ncbi:MAG: universal stress protein [Chloroflexi bacterium]|nr:universal stress protein [Chloroflexota bacterium]
MGASSVLVAVQGERSDDEAVKLACELISSPKGKLHIVYVIEVERGFPVDAEIAPATAKGEEVLKHMEEVAKSYKCKPEAELVQARQAGAAVVREAVEKNVDTVVLGIPYSERYGSFSMGDTIPYVLKNAPCRVIIWRDSAVKPYTNGYTH